MQTFLEETIRDILSKHEDVSELQIILPSKRAGGFFLHHLKRHLKSATFLPHILSIEEFVENLADLNILPNQDLLLYSYSAYQSCSSISEKDDFETYCSWIRPLLDDINEIDRYLVDVPAFFDYLLSIKTLERWNATSGRSQLVHNYLEFWRGLPEFYEHLKALLASEGLGYQGMVYRKACEELEHYLLAHGSKPHIFIGFNALNTAEEFLLKELLETGHCEIYWDADTAFFEEPPHSASHFMRSYFNSWKYYQGNPPPLGRYFKEPKNITIVESQRSISQAKCAGEILAKMDPEDISKTAIVLADERLLMPLIHSLPDHIRQVNITMGAALSYFPQPQFFRSVLYLQQKTSRTMYFKDVFSVLQHPLCRRILPSARKVIKQAIENNMAYLTVEFIAECCDPAEKDVATLLFGQWKDNAGLALKHLQHILGLLKEAGPYSEIEKVLLFEIHQVLKSLVSASQRHNHIKSLKSLHTLFEEGISNAAVDFKGDAYQGLQIMGVLETRALDFEQLIMLSVNEGILPSGKSSASFITYDLKKQFGLPMYDEKDAVYSYHFYRLLQRTSRCWLLYNGLAEGLSAGEKSRFLLQLETARQESHQLEHLVCRPPLQPDSSALMTIAKSPEVIEQLRRWCGSGISPSALTTFVRNPIDFYYRYVLQVEQDEILEEVVEYATLGTIVHNSLEKLYKPLEGSSLNIPNLETLLKKTEGQVVTEFEAVYKRGNYRKGKNLLIFEVAKKYVQNLIKMDLSRVQQGTNIKLMAVEKKVHIPVKLRGADEECYLKGTVDRLELCDDTWRIIDYKTGAVNPGQLNIVSWDDLKEDYHYSKAFQVLMYAYLMRDSFKDQPAEAGIISFKNMANGFMPFGIKSSKNARNNRTFINAQVLSNFEEVLLDLTEEIMEPGIPFKEKEV